MSFNKLKILKILLYLGSIYYIIGAIAHFFGLTIFPFYDGALYTPYHDTVIALVAIILSMLLYVTAKNPEKNIDALNVIIMGGIIAILFSVGIVLNIDFVSLGAPGKKTQTIVEAVLLTLYVFFLILFKPKSSK
jgi:hypothetical protein